MSGQCEVYLAAMGTSVSGENPTGMLGSPVSEEEVASRSAARAVGCVPGLHRHLKLVPETLRSLYIWIILYLYIFYLFIYLMKNYQT